MFSTRKIISAVLAAVVLLGATTACGPDWFGNGSAGPRPPAPNKCDLAPATTAADQVPGVPAGMASYQMSVEVKALRWREVQDEDEPYVLREQCDDYAVPVAVHVYGTADGQAGFVLETGEPLPYDNPAVMTPWSRQFALIYDPKAHPNPEVSLDFAIKHVVDYPGADPLTGDRVSLGCTIRVNGFAVATDLRAAMGPGEYIRCTHTWRMPV